MRVVLINILVLIGLFVPVELVFGTWFSQTHALYQFTKPRSVEILRPNPNSGEPTEILYTRDENGLRGLSGDVSKIDILTVGGSTTDQRFLDNSQTYQAVLRGLFQAAGHDISIVNAGIDGQTTFGHIENFGSWFNLIDGLKTRYVLFYVGINDALIIAEKSHYDTMQIESRLGRLRAFVEQKSAFFQVYTIFKGVLEKPEIRHVFKPKNLALKPPFATDPMLSDAVFQDHAIQADLTQLTERIETLANLTRDFGAEPIFVTQRGAVWRREDGQVHGTRELEPGYHQPLMERFGDLNGVDIYRVQRAVADAILDGCETADAICLDLMKDLDFDIEADFYDELHTTASGSARIAEYLFSELSRLNVP